ncbi:MAG: PQQ-binding-like beta-propeller repeat protein [Acidobacteriota bacterium]|nr:PQQ-binding-like beta-propeller repeat protein [Acidobacteriota bacterium]
MKQSVLWLATLMSLVPTISWQAGEPHRSPGAASLEAPPRPAFAIPTAPGSVGTPGSFEVSMDWYWPALGAGIGDSGLALADLERDGSLEIVAGASSDGFEANRYWYVLRWDGTTYEKVWSHLPYDQTLEALAVAQVDDDPALEVLAAVGQTVMIYDGSTRALQGTVAVGLTPNSLVAGDVDGDGEAEIVVCNLGNVYTYSAVTGAQELTLPGVGGVALALGQVDDDAGLEIGVTRNDHTARILDGATGMVDWEIATGLGYAIAFGDLNDDGYDEVVGGFEATDGVRVYDVAADQLLWDYPVFNLANLQVADVLGSSIPEVIYGDAQFGDMHVLSAAGSSLYSVNTCSYGVTNIVVGDADGDGTKEFLWGSGFDVTGGDYLCAASPVSAGLEWRSTDLSTPFLGLDVGDVDADGEMEILATSFAADSNHSAGRYLIFDAQSKELEYITPAGNTSYRKGVWAGRLLNTDADPQLEICLTEDNVFPAVSCYDGLHHTLEWTFQTPDFDSFFSILPYDIDGDGTLELLAGAGIFSSPNDGLVYALDPSDGTPVWTSDPIPFGFRPSILRGANIDGDMTREILAVSETGVFSIFDALTGDLEFSQSLSASALLLTDLDGKPGEEILLGTYSETVEVFDPSTLQTSLLAGPLSGAVFALGRGVFAGQDLFVVSTEDQLGFYSALDAAPLATVDLSYGTGRSDSLLVANLYVEPNSNRVLVNTGLGLAEIGADGIVIFANGFESGDTTGWMTGP